MLSRGERKCAVSEVRATSTTDQSWNVFPKVCTLSKRQSRATSPKPHIHGYGCCFQRQTERSASHDSYVESTPARSTPGNECTKQRSRLGGGRSAWFRKTQSRGLKTRLNGGGPMSPVDGHTSVRGHDPPDNRQGEQLFLPSPSFAKETSREKKRDHGLMTVISITEEDANGGSVLGAHSNMDEYADGKTEGILGTHPHLTGRCAACSGQRCVPNKT